MAPVNEIINKNKFSSMQIEKYEMKIDNHNGNDEMVLRNENNFNIPPQRREIIGEFSLFSFLNKADCDAFTNLFLEKHDKKDLNCFQKAFDPENMVQIIKWIESSIAPEHVQTLFKLLHTDHGEQKNKFVKKLDSILCPKNENNTKEISMFRKKSQYSIGDVLDDSDTDLLIWSNLI